MKVLKFFVIFVFVFFFLACSENEDKTKNVYFYDDAGALVEKITINEGEIFKFPTPIEKEGYSFKGWEKVDSNQGDCYKMTYEQKEYTVTYYVDGSIVNSEKVLYGEPGKYVPLEKEGYDYIFDVDVSSVKSDLNVNISYQIKKYKVVFMFDGQILDEVNVEYLDDLSDYSYEITGYVFKKWDKELYNIKSDLVVNGIYEIVNYNIEYVLNNYEMSTSTWNNKVEFIDEFYGDFYEYLTTNYQLLGITRSGNTYSLTLNSVTITFASVDDLKQIGIYDFEKTLGNLIYAPINRTTNELVEIIPNEKYFLNSSKYLQKYQDLDRYFLNVIVNRYTGYSKGYQPTGGRVQIFFRFQQWQQGTSIPEFDQLPSKFALNDNFNVTHNNPTTYNVKSEVVLTNPTSEYKFLGWYDNEFFIGEAITKLDCDNLADITLYAMWDKDVLVHEVTFIGFGNKILKTEQIENGQTVAAPTLESVVGFKFYKWDKDYQNITTDIVIKALYEPIDYRIIYSTGFDDVICEGKAKYTILDNYELPELTKKGFLFLGWYSNGERISKTTYGDLNLEAKWIKFDIDNNNVGTGTLQMVVSEKELGVSRSMNVYVKKGKIYLDYNEVEFSVINKDGEISIDEYGFVKAIKPGKALILAVFGEDACCYEVEVLENNEMDYVGHTGCRGTGIVQNTASAFEEGGKRGYYALECDVRVSKEVVYYVHHDDTFLVSGTVMPFLNSSLTEYGLQAGGLQASCRWDTVLSQLTVHKNGDTSTTSKLITIEDYLEICKKYNTKALLELKWTTGINSNDQSNLKGLVELVKKHEMYENAIFMTSMKNCLTFIRENYKDATLQFLSGASSTTDSNINWCIENNISLDASSAQVTKAIVDKMHKAFLYVNSYTVNSSSAATQLTNLGVDYITTDDLKK